jgi:IPT/TIG domain
MSFLAAAHYRSQMIRHRLTRNHLSFFRQTGGRLSSCLFVVMLMMMISGDRYSSVASAQAPGPNPIVLENQQPGSSGWFYSKLANDATGQIKGYASASSVNQNENITFYVTVNPTQTYTIDFYRLGWYGGLGGRLRSHVGPLAGVQQPSCPTDPNTGMIACNWTPGYVLSVPTDWTSGVYAALLTNEQGFQNYVIFVVRDGRPAAFLYQHPIATEQAYNNYPNDGATGKSLYAFNSYGANTVSGNTSAVKVSFDRPIADSGLGGFIHWEINTLRWLERSGYDVTYSTSIETHANGAELRNHKAFLSPGHDEYWSKEMFDAAENARDTGVNLAFFAANSIYTQVRFEPSSTGVANRVMVCYRNLPWFPIDPVQGPTTTTEFRMAPVNRPEQTLVGVQYSATLPNTDYVVTNSSHWAYAGTGFHDGDIVSGIVGYEADSLMPNYPPPNSANQTLLSRSPYVDNGVTKYLNSSIYQAPSGAWVFASGTMSWSWALDDVPGPFAQFRVDSRIQRATANILNAFLTGAPPTITTFTPASGPVGATVSISGTSFTGATAVTFNGSAATFTLLSDTAIQATAPAGATTGPLSVTTPAGTATSPINFTVVGVPTITSFTPTSGPVGTNVTITGANFTGATAVTFNGSATSFTITSDTAIEAPVPAGATTGPLSVTTPGGTATSSTNFTVVNPPTISSFTPTGGPEGTSVTISGTDFTGATAVAFNGTATSFAATSDTAIQATVPVGATTGPLSVTTPAGTATSPTNFTVISPPTITSFTPTGASVGASVTIDGTNFNGATSVKFNGSPASFTVTSDTAIGATVPAGATSGPISVTTPGGTATSTTSFTVAPTITSFAPTSGLVGASVTISGTNFTGATAVTFNGGIASFTVTSAMAIQATVPAGATTGPLTVTTPGGTATSAANFTVVSPPTITSFTPTSGAVGTSVTISGTNFAGATTVRFNGTAAGFSVISTTAVQATVPTGATTGPVSVTTPGGTATSGTNFIVAPTLTSFTPTSGLVGTSVTISGTNFNGATSVRFNGTAATFTVTSATAIQATVPAGAATGPLTVTTPGGTATSPSAFTVRVTLTVTKTGIVGGTVTSSPSGINCGGTCSAAFNSGSVVTLTAAPTFPSLFSSWSGCDSVSGNMCTVTMGSNKTVTANFFP